jgi:thermitase
MFKRSLFVSLFLILICASMVFAVENISRENPEPYVPGEILVGFKPEATSDQIDAAVASIGGEVVGTCNLPTMKIKKVRISSMTSSAMDAAINDLRTAPFSSEVIKVVEPNVIRQAHQAREPSGDVGILSQSSDPLLPQQWGYYDIGANWINVHTLPAPVVAVLDTGVDYTHPDLVGKVIKGKDFVNDDTDPMDDHGHGTHVAGVIAALTNNAYGMAGISWNGKILAVKVLDFKGYGDAFGIAKGITYAADNPSVKVINMSLGGGYSSIEYDAVMYAVVEKKKLLVASAGNSNTSTPSYPAGFSIPFPSKVLAVAAHGTDHCRASFSNYGTWVSITAPGVNILSTVPPLLEYDGDFTLMSGTSMAAPHVAGAAAVAWAAKPESSNSTIGSMIMTKGNSFGGLNRNGTCWPIDGSVFDRLDLLHLIEPTFYENPGTKGFIHGFAFNAENGEPLTGAKLTAKQGRSVTGTDYVPYYGHRTYINTDDISPAPQEGYGLFSVLAKVGTTKLLLNKAKFVGITLPDIAVPSGGGTYAGNLPVVPVKPYYWLAVTWNYGYADAWYDAYLYVPGYATYYGGFPGSLTTAPWVKLFWDSDYSESEVNLRKFSEVFRIKKLVTGTYQFYVVDWKNPNSGYWAASGIKAYIYQWDATLAEPKLVATFTPPAGTGTIWNICTIKGNTITLINELLN